MATLRWGFFGAGQITHDFVNVLHTLPKSNHLPSAIAARDLERAEKFRCENKLLKAYGNYEELASDPEIDIIYIGTVNSEHFVQIKLAILHGKHVLCEKPLCLNVKHAKEVSALARQSNVFLMEGYWTRFFPAFKYLEEYLQSGKIGDVKQLISGYGAVVNKPRLRLLELGGGALMNYGVYGIQYATKLFGRPDKIVATGHLLETGADASAVISLLYNDGQKIVTIMPSSVSISPNFNVFGTNGVVGLGDRAYAPTKVKTSEGVIQFDLPKSDIKLVFPYAMGFIYEMEEVRACINSGKLESPRMSLDDSIMILEISDEIRRQLGVRYPQDE